ncbi:ABC transporter permease [Salibacterium aidingense]|uniref:ABC transporter permease n=1 Tax=Salibacterium aidingense TaxID=384933 RepID=UPI003BDBCD44
MFKLIKLELKKFNVRIAVRLTIVISLFISVLCTSIPVLERMDTGSPGELFSDFPSAFEFINIVNGTVFIIFTAVLISKLVVYEFINKTVYQLFTYPVSHRKIMISKMVIAAGWTFSAVLASSILSTLIFLIGNEFFLIIEGAVQIEVFLQQTADLVILALTSAGISLFPMFIAIKYQSTPAVLLSSIGIAAILNFNPSGTSLSMITIVPLSIAAVSAMLTYAAVLRLTYNDIF